MGFVFTQTASDNFQRANEEPLNPANWTNNTFGGGDLAIVSHFCVAHNAVGGGTEFYSGVAFPENQFAKTIINQFQSGSSVIEIFILSALDSSRLYALALVALGDGTAELVLESAPGASVAIKTGLVVKTGDVMALGLAGGTVYGFYNGVVVLSFAADGSSTSGDPGLGVSWSAAQTDTSVSLFSAGSLSFSEFASTAEIVQPGGGRIEAAARVESPRTSLLGTDFGTKVLG